MIDLEKEGTYSKGKRKGQERIALGIKDEITFSKYGNSDDIWLSRSAFDEFKKCKRCFYLIRKRGFIEPGTPQFTINSTTDKLLKKEFDLCRKDKKSHQILIDNKLDHIIPYKNEETAINIYGDPIIPSKSKKPYEKMEAWRSNYHGLQTRFKKTNFILYGSVDDIWLDTKNNTLILADYKSQANEKKVTQETYWDGDFKSGYQRQLDFYYYLLKQQNLKEEISNDAYLLVVNARGLEDTFDDKLVFESTLIHTKVKDDDLENEIQEMIDVFNSDNVPESNKLCKNCAYARQRSVIDKL